MWTFGSNRPGIYQDKKFFKKQKNPATSNMRFLCTCILFFKQKLDAKILLLAYQPLGIP